jgi:hypothetical protein
MIGILFLFAIGLWVALSLYLARKIPKWLRITRYPSVVSVISFLLLLIVPFVDEIVGMRQFETLCAERTAITVSPDAEKVKRGKSVMSAETILPGFFIKIKSYKVSYIDIDTGKVFLTYDYFSTSGGRVAGLALMGGSHGCSADDRENKNHRQLQQIPIYQKIVNGESQ